MSALMDYTAHVDPNWKVDPAYVRRKSTLPPVPVKLESYEIEPPCYLKPQEMLTVKEKASLAAMLIADLGSIPNHRRPVQMIELIMKYVCLAHGIKDKPEHTVINKQSIAYEPRQISHAFAMVMVRRPVSRLSYFFKRDHSTLIHSFDIFGLTVVEAIVARGSPGMKRRALETLRWRQTKMNHKTAKNQNFVRSLELLGSK